MIRYFETVNGQQGLLTHKLSFVLVANSAATGAGIIWFVTYSPFFFLQLRYDTLTRADKLFSCILSNTAMAFATQLMTMFEGSSKYTSFFVFDITYTVFHT